MIKNLCAAFGLLSVLSAGAMEVTFSGQSLPVLEFTPAKTTGLEKVFIAYNSGELTEMRVDGVSPDVTVSIYSNLGGGFAEPVAFSLEGNAAVIGSPKGNMGYIIEENGRSTCYWLVDYAASPCRLSGVTPYPEQDCDNTKVSVNGEAPAIHYFSIDGRQVELDRGIKLTYKNLEWDKESESYIQKDFIKEVSHLSGSPIALTPPLYCNAVVEVTGDKFLKEWGRGQSVESDLIYAHSVTAETTAEQTNLPDEDSEELSNQIKTETQGMGGSAPAEISFRAYTTDAVIHNEWQIASDMDFEYIDYRFNEQNLDYTFTDEGTYYVRFVGSNSDGSCETVGETYTVSIGSSDLRIPNAFTPNDDGVNDVWKVGYRSLLSFRCTIFDRYGNELYSFSDPNLGWDGKYKGKYVKAGVYFYVIEAKGADGKKYKKGGDINIIRSKRNSSTSSGGGAATE